ncbi:LysM peptidoglycan-binding domain-containing protein [Hymenobacter sp. 5516J-16]|uniref:LysM peptidoglycan-binding domain-containing protein n=1 Tax=Hymenobacter sp. 5516J-16 TaxID=2932253 RepID=UPI001FD249D4|nr:LysM domain-containing protein [Hymenobacter sp. 5516J-16]UOQ78269.1 LysM peptidoglycan-binding domain-containing protein [Hymenobacter sp. 5516J-16]
MRFLARTFYLLTGLSLASFAAQAQQAPPAPTLSDDSVRVMSGLVQTSVRQLRAIYFEPNDTRAVALIDAALVEIPALNQRLSHYTASLPREQQQLLAQRLRSQPWQVELNTLLRSPQFKNFDTRAAKNPALKDAAARLHASGFVGTTKAPAASPAPAAPATVATVTPAPAKAQPAPVVAAKVAGAALAAPAVTASGTSAKTTTPSAAPAPAKPQPTAPAKATTPKAARSHTVQKGETLFSISKQYKVTPAQLQEWNSKNDGAVKIGEVLTVEATK